MTDQELIRALRTNGTKADGCHDCYLGYLAYQAADRLTSLMKDLGRVTRQWRICELRPSKAIWIATGALGKQTGRNVIIAVLLTTGNGAARRRGEHG